MKIGNVTIISGQGGYEMRKSSKTGPGEEFARYNPSNEDSIRDAARYVGATKTETAGVIRYHRAASVVGRARGSVRSPAKTAAARENGRKGGRPKQQPA